MSPGLGDARTIRIAGKYEKHAASTVGNAYSQNDNLFFGTITVFSTWRII
jgi:hypothetical protein